MIQVTAHMRVLLAVEPVDFRKGIDGLSRVCRAELAHDPFGGYVFVFRNRRCTSIRLLTYDGQGFWIAQKRLSSGKFRFWPEDVAGKTHQLEAHELYVLLSGGDYRAADGVPKWRPVAV
jgi:transposase